MTLRILHLYPRELGINGDVGNVIALVERARRRGAIADVVSYEPGDAVPGDIDLIHIGSGPVAGQRAVHQDLLSIAPRLRGLAAEGVPVLAIAAGWQLLGHELVLADGERLEGAGVLPSRAMLLASRTVGELLVDSAFGRLGGFENHSSSTDLLDGAEALGTVAAAKVAAPDGAPRQEGVRVGSAIGTNLHGPVLPMNPVLADALLDAAAAHAGEPLEPDAPTELALLDDYARRSREAIAGRLR